MAASRNCHFAAKATPDRGCPSRSSHLGSSAWKLTTPALGLSNPLRLTQPRSGAAVNWNFAPGFYSFAAWDVAFVASRSVSVLRSFAANPLALSTSAKSFAKSPKRNGGKPL